MSEAEFVRRWNADQPQYRAWGYFIVSEMQQLISERLQDASIESLLRIPPKSRLKETTSLVDKAFNRGKAYADPYSDITDKVGVRFVVLLNSDVRVVEDLLRQHDAWIARKDRDYEKERDEKPFVFSYQSLHYIVFAKSDMEIDGVAVAAHTPCEVQIRTLLQHAHSELSHSNLYKPHAAATPEMLRASAKSMALVEAADDYFDVVAKKTEEGDRFVNDAKKALAHLYSQYIGTAEFAYSNTVILDAFRGMLNRDIRSAIDDLIVSDGYVVERIRQRSADKLLYRQPAILYAYYLVKHHPSTLKDRWPLAQPDLRPLFVDMGVNFDSARR